MKRYYLMAAVAGILAGCGGGGGDDGDSANGPGNGSGQTDAFIARVSSIIGTTLDEAEPISIDDVQVSDNDTAEAQPI